MIRLITNLVFPPKCIFCRKVLPVDSCVDICSGCYRKIPFLDEGIPNTCPPDEEEYYDEVIAICEYTGIIRSTLINYKFHDKSCYFRALGRLMSEKVKKMTNICNFDIISSVPLHKRRQSERGYNQAALLAKEVGRQTGIRVNTALLTRCNNTVSQSLLTRKERLENLKNAFSIKDPGKIRDKAILLIDDVLTTGTTMNECSRVLKKAGAKRVTAAVMATGRKY